MKGIKRRKKGDKGEKKGKIEMMMIEDDSSYCGFPTSLTYLSAKAGALERP